MEELPAHDEPGSIGRHERDQDVIWKLRTRIDTRADDGIQLVEVAVAIAVMAVAILAVVSSMGSGMTLVGHSRQRSAGASVATERLERIRNVPYDRLALYEHPVPSTIVGHPNHAVTADGRYTLADGTTEKLVVDTTDDATPAGALKHLDDPFTLEPEGTEFEVYQYVTWVEDPNVGDTKPDITGVQSYKRAIVVAIWKFPVHFGPEHRVIQSTLVSEGGVPAPAATPTPGPTATPVATAPVATPAAACGVIEMLSGTGGHTNQTTLQVRLSRNTGSGCGSLTGYLSNTGIEGSWVNAATVSTTPVTVTWTIPAGDGPKTIYARFVEGNGTSTTTTSTNLFLDTTAPTTPTALTKVACTFTGNDRNVSFNWGTSIDPSPGNSLVGYRVYKSVDSALFAPVGITSANNFGNTDSKGKGLRYTVRAYDKAGNESGDSNVISYSKNAC